MPAQIVAPFIQQLQGERSQIRRGRSKMARKSSYYETYRSRTSRRDYKK